MPKAAALALALLAPHLVAGEGEAPAPAPLTIQLPAASELDQLTELVARFAGVSVQYNPQKVTGTVRLAVRGQLDQSELWNVYNQVLLAQGLTTVVQGEPPVYQVLPIAEAAALTTAVPGDALRALRYQPGFAVVLHESKHLAAENAVKALTALFANQLSQVRTLGQDGRRIVIAAPQPKVREALSVLALLDRPGLVPAVRLLRPQRTAAQALQAAATGAWAALGRVGERQRVAEIQVAPDGVQLLLVAAQEDIGELDALVQELDRSEPVESRTYRPRFFGIEEVANLLQQIYKAERGGAGLDVVKDKLTSSLIIKATTQQHARIAEVLRTLDEAPATARRQMRSFAVKHRQADELAKVIGALIASGAGGDEPVSAAPPAGAPPQPAPVGGPPGPAVQSLPPGAAGNAASYGQPMGAPALPAAPAASGPVTIQAGDSDLVLATDPITNRLIALGEPRALDQVETLLRQLDRRQPQVELEIILVTLAANQTRDLGVELAGLIQSGQVSTAVSSLFGLSTPVAGVEPARAVADAAGFSGVTFKPGDFAAVVRALETVSQGRSLIRTQIVVANNGKALINSVVQEPISSINSTQTVAAVTFAGTSDAGTQIAITPQISPADCLSVTYNINQSAFIGQSTVTADGSVIPPAKRSDNVSSVATIPDGHVIALGGLSNRSIDTSESRLPWVGTIPVLGNLFKSQSKADNSSHFYVFIRASVLRHDRFADLRWSSARQADAAGIDAGWPRLEPRLVGQPGDPRER